MSYIVQRRRHVLLLAWCLALCCADPQEVDAATTAASPPEAQVPHRLEPGQPGGSAARSASGRRPEPAAVEVLATARTVAERTGSTTARDPSGISLALTLQIALIVVVMVLVAAWPFRRGRSHIPAIDDEGRSSRDGPPPDHPPSRGAKDPA
jgi:hypothetical protein